MRWCYDDHVGLWNRELAEWLPPAVFDAHVHLGLPEAVGQVSSERRRSALLTYTDLSWEDFLEVWQDLFSGHGLLGAFAVPFPQREVELGPANAYIIELMRREPRLKGFLLADPRDPAPSVAAFERGLEAGVRFSGVKPYADRLGKSNLSATPAEFLSEGLLEFMDGQSLIMLLHTAGMGVGTPEWQIFLRRMAERWPRIRVVLAHMGRYIRHEQFLRFMDSGVLEDCPSLYLEMSSATCPEVYERVLRCDWLWPRLLFGSDIPFGLITGVERWSDTHGPVFMARDSYPWSDPVMEVEFARERQQLTYNTYHVIKALKEAMERLGICGPRAEALKQLVFSGNALGLLSS